MRRVLVLLFFYPTLLWTLLLARCTARRWWDTVDAHVMIGALPFASDAVKLQALGVGAVINTCEEYFGPVKTYEELGIEQLYLPTLDFTPPKLDDCRKGVSFIESQIARGRKIYVHCKAGRGRSATIVMCYLIKSRSWTAEQAQQYLLQIRPQVNPRLARRKVIEDYAKALDVGFA